MTKNQIIAQIYTDKEYIKIIKNLCGDKTHFIDDLTQEVFLMMMEKPESLIQDLYEAGKLKFYFIRVVMNQVNSSTSMFYRKYRATEIKHETSNDFALGQVETEEEFNYDISNTFDIYDYIISNKILNWDQVEMFNLYYRINPSFIEEDITVKMGYTSMARRLGLSKSNIAQQINLIKYKLFSFLLQDGKVNDFLDKEMLTSFVNSYEASKKKSRKKQLTTINI